MKVTRYTQSCLFIEDQGARILIDPSVDEKDHLGEFGKLDAVFYTHEHSDHFDAEMAKRFVEESIAPVYANASTSKLIDASKTVVEDGKEYVVGVIKVKAIDLPHCLMPDGSKGPQNTGYLMNSKLFHPGDGISLEGLTVEALALPLTGPDISMKDAFGFAKQLSAKKCVAIHYDKLGANPEAAKNMVERLNMPFELIGLKNGQSIEL